MSIRDLLDKKGETYEAAKGILDKAAAENRDLTPEEDKHHSELFNKISDLNKQIEIHNRQADLDRQMADFARTKPENRGGSKGEITVMDGFRGMLLNGRSYRGAGSELFNALQGDSQTGGGYLKAPEEFVQMLIKAVDDQLFIRQLATKHTLTMGDSLGCPSLDADPADADWTAEILTGNEDSTMVFGKRNLKTGPLAKRLKISESLLRLSTMPVEQIVANRLGYKFAVTQEKAFMTGSGANQPLGVFTASNDGIPTSRDFSTGNTTTSIQFDGLIEAKFSLKAGYQRNAQWIFHRDAVKQVSKLKDGEGQYLWQNSTQADRPDTLLGMPVNMSEYAPNTFTTGQYVGMLADFSYYWIADSLEFNLKPLHELYAETNQVGYIGRAELDAMPVLGEAFSRVKLA